jgi:CRISPR-associated endonuclease/helicase Cas3
MEKVLAKSRRTLQDGTVVEVTLAQHTRHVIEAAKSLFGDENPSQLGQQWLRFFRIPDQWDAFRKNLIAACALHDVGKANDSFQKALTGVGTQAIRHEHLSALLIAEPNVRAWLETSSINFPLVLSAVLTHHLKASDRRDGFAVQNESGPSRLRLVNHSGGAQETFDIVVDELGIEKLNFANLPVVWTLDEGKQSIRDAREIIQSKILQPYWQVIKKNENASRLLLAVRSALIAADSAGSGIVRVENGSVGQWIRENVTKRPLLTSQQVFADIIEKRRLQMVASGNWKNWNDFQKACDHLPDRALLLAPCGSGKTLAAWRWIAAQLEKRPVGHAIFLYPTRATAREGFQDYVSWAPEADAALMHGTSEFDLEGMFENAPEADERRDRVYRRTDAQRRLFSLSYWPRRVFSATVDQFLAFMQYSYGPMCMLPVLANSVLVVDEVHSFDNNMFSALKDFLRAFDVPVLCMTATLSESRRRELVEDCKLAAPPEWPEDLKQIADLRRYRFNRVADRATAEKSVRNALAEGKRVLWVVNQVKRAHAIVRSFMKTLPDGNDDDRLVTEDGVPIVCYHSRFRLRDRVDRHAETMKYLKATNSTAALGVTTQVCEMSLDIDVDLLVTEECPVSSLVQRMGRCNRNRNARSLNDSGHVIVYPPENNDILPYDKNDLSGLSEFLTRAEGEDLSQTDLDEIMRSVPGPALQGDKMSRFLESGPYAVGPRDDGGDGFRDATEFSRQSVLLNDVQSYLSATIAEKPGFIVPVPNGRVMSRDDVSAAFPKLAAWISVAPNDNYHRAVGFLNQPVSQWSLHE